MAGVFAAVLGPVGLIGGALVGGALGGAIGILLKKSVNLDEAALQEIDAQLNGGKVGVVVAVDEHEMASTADQLSNAGGAVQQFVLPAEALTEVAEAMPHEYSQGFDALTNDLNSVQIVGPGSLTPLT